MNQIPMLKCPRLLLAQMVNEKIKENDLNFKLTVEKQVLDNKFDLVIIDEVHDKITGQIRSLLEKHNGDLVCASGTPWKNIIAEFCEVEHHYTLLDHRRKVLAGGVEGYKLKDHPWLHWVMLNPIDKDTRD